MVFIRRLISAILKKENIYRVNRDVFKWGIKISVKPSFFKRVLNLKKNKKVGFKNSFFKMGIFFLGIFFFQGVINADLGIMLMSGRSGKKGDIEYGILGNIGTFNDRPVSTSLGFLTLDVTQRLRGNLFFYEGKFYGSVSSEVFSFASPGIQHRCSASVSSYRLPDFKQSNQVIFQESLVYSLYLPSQNMGLEFGGGRDVMDDLILKPTVGLFIETNYGLLRFEWDSHQVNIGMSIPVDTHYCTYMMFTPQILRKEDSFLRQLSFGVGLKQNLWDDFLNEKYREALDDKMSMTRRMVQDEIKSSDQAKELTARIAETAGKNNSKKHYLVLARMQNGLDYYYQKQYEKALNEYLAVIAVMPDLPIAYTRAGSIYHQMGNKELAIQYWQKSYELDPDNFELADMLNGLKSELKKSEAEPGKK